MIEEMNIVAFTKNDRRVPTGVDKPSSISGVLSDKSATKIDETFVRKTVVIRSSRVRSVWVLWPECCAWIFVGNVENKEWDEGRQMKKEYGWLENIEGKSSNKSLPGKEE